jgi:heparin binding hemagglutinin HbhA
MTQTKTKYPSAFYAAAGVGDLVYEQLRKLQTKAIAFGSEQAPEWKRKVADLSAKLDTAKVRDSVVTSTQVAAETATKVYGTLVARGEKAFRYENSTATPAATPANTAVGTTVKPTVKPAVKTPAPAPVAKKAQPRKRVEA